MSPLVQSAGPRNRFLGLAHVATAVAVLSTGIFGDAATAGEPPQKPAEAEIAGLLQGEAREFFSRHLEKNIIVLPGVFAPGEAIGRVLPFMKENPSLFRGKRVLEIGTGSGIISLYAAKLGAAAVVATDISEAAVTCARDNAKRLGYSSIMEVRLVPESEPTAYSVVKSGERFDLLISNPPYSLDIEAPRNTAVTDTGDLGFSIVRGLRQHLSPSGMAVLYYNSLFYHHLMVKFARREGFVVRSHQPDMLTPWEATTLFNSYLERFLPGQGLEPGSLRFEYGEDLGQIAVAGPVEPLLPGSRSGHYPGMMVISMPTGNGSSPARD